MRPILRWRSENVATSIRVLIATAQGTPLSAQQHYEIDEAFVRLPSAPPLAPGSGPLPRVQNAIGSEVTRAT